VGNEQVALKIRRDNAAPENASWRIISASPVNEDINGLEIDVEKAAIALVSALDEEKNLISGFTIHGEYSREKNDPGIGFRNQRDGRKRSMNLIPDTEVQFTVSSPGYTPQTITDRIAAGEMKNLVVTLKRASPMTRVTRNKKPFKATANQE
jgi:hypothetical protein